MLSNNESTKAVTELREDIVTIIENSGDVDTYEMAQRIINHILSRGGEIR